MHPLLQINDLRIDFDTAGGTTTAIKGITLTINRGEITGIAGESGSGKSVTALAILQLLGSPPARYVSGEILFSPDGHSPVNIRTLTPRQLRMVRGKGIAMIFQEPMTSLNPVFTCGSQVTEAVQLHRGLGRQPARNVTLELFEKVQLPNPAAIFDRYPHQLSGGQKQRVMIALAMSGDPALLICDEPTTALDTTVQQTVLRLIADLQAETGMGVIFISHDLAVIAEIADQAVIMRNGTFVEQGTLPALFHNPTHPYTRSLLACRPALYTKGTRLPAVGEVVAAPQQPEIPDHSSAPASAPLPAAASIQVPAPEGLPPSPSAAAPVPTPKNQEPAAAAQPTEALQLLPGNPHPNGSNLQEPPTETPARQQLSAGLQVPDPPHADPTEVLFRVKSLHVWYPMRKSLTGKVRAYNKAVNGVSFDVYRGETLGLVGESGSGKTTLGRALLRLVEPQAGEIRYGGQHLAQLRGDELTRFRKNAQIVFQDPYSSLNPSMTAGSALEEPLRVHEPTLGPAQRKQRVMDLLQKVQLLPEHYQRYPHEFSGGQRQRLVIARALICRPECVVCDESVSALDLSVQAQVLNLLNDLKNEFGFTCIFISHDLAVVQYISDRIIVMKKGVIEEIGAATQVYQHPSSPYTRELLAAMPSL